MAYVGFMWTKTESDLNDFYNLVEAELKTKEGSHPLQIFKLGFYKRNYE